MESNSDKYYGLIAKYYSQEISKSESQELNAWMTVNSDNRDMFEELGMVWDYTGETLKETPYVSTDSKVAFEDIKIKLAEFESSPNGFISRIRPIYRVAAILVLALGIGCFYSSNHFSSQDPLVAHTINVSAIDDVKKEIFLLDESLVILKKGVSVKYNSLFDVDNRVIKFTNDGQAFFNIKEAGGKPFTVLAGDTKITVLGTKFIVKLKQGEVIVSVHEGRVSVADIMSREKPKMITAGFQSIGRSNEESIIRKIEDINLFAWHSEEFVFNNDKLKYVISTLENAFEIKIETNNPDILNCSFTGQYYNSRPLIEILDAISESAELKLEIINDSYFLSGDGC